MVNAKKSIMFFILIEFIFLCGCQTQMEPSSTVREFEAFGIYLLKDESISFAENKKRDLEDFTLAEVPLISTADILTYDWDNHRIELKEEAYDALYETLSGNLPISGRPFVAISEGERIYAGAFWSMLSSMSFNGVTIVQPVNPDEQQIQITLGYPSDMFFVGEDPRDDLRVWRALKDAGLLAD